MEETVRALVEELIPSDDTPGAREAGTADEVLGEIEVSPTLTEGIAALERASFAAYGIGFAAASGELRRALMDQLARGQQPAGWSGPPVATFWMAMRNLTMSLFYGSELSRAVTGFPGPSVDRGGYRQTIVEPEPR